MVIYFKKIKNAAVMILLSAVIVCAGANNGKKIKTMIPVEKRVVIIDAGHGGFDPGKTGRNGENEKLINLEIARCLQEYLEQSGAVVIMTRTDDNAAGETKREDMRERKRIANDSDGDILVSIHQNSFTTEEAEGAQVFYYEKSEEGKRLAECIQYELVNTLEPEKERDVKANDDYYMLKTVDIPSVIVECGFLSNREEEKKLNDEEYRQKVAWAVYKGIAEYFNGKGEK